MSGPWISLHVFHAGDQDRLILDGVAPAVEERSSAILRWYLVRYWNGGPHLRLRVLPRSAARRWRLVADLEQALGVWLAAHPGGAVAAEEYHRWCERIRRLEDRFIGTALVGREWLEGLEDLHAMDCVEERPYEFDTDRYGEGDLRRLAEEHFAASTEVALAVLAAHAGRRGAILAWSLRLAAALPFALGWDGERGAELFAAYCESLDYAREPAARGAPCRPYEEVREEILAGIGEASGEVVSSTSAASFLAHWRRGLAATCRGIERARRRSPAPQTTANLLIDYLHMTHNRLGVSLGDELRLVELLHRGFRSRAGGGQR